MQNFPSFVLSSPRWKIMFTAIVVTLANKNTALHSLPVTSAILIPSFALCPDSWVRELRIEKKIQSYVNICWKAVLVFLAEWFLLCKNAASVSNKCVDLRDQADCLNLVLFNNTCKSKWYLEIMEGFDFRRNIQQASLFLETHENGQFKIDEVQPSSSFESSVSNCVFFQSSIKPIQKRLCQMCQNLGKLE